MKALTKAVYMKVQALGSIHVYYVVDMNDQANEIVSCDKWVEYDRCSQFELQNETVELHRDRLNDGVTTLNAPGEVIRAINKAYEHGYVMFDMGYQLIDGVTA